MKIDKEDYKLLESALNSYRQMMSDDEDDEQDNSKEIEVCKKYIKLINKPVETTNEQPLVYASGHIIGSGYKKKRKG